MEDVHIISLRPGHVIGMPVVMEENLPMEDVLVPLDGLERVVKGVGSDKIYHCNENLLPSIPNRTSITTTIYPSSLF